MKVIKDQQAVKMNHWKGLSEVAKVEDMGVQEGYKDLVTDENRVFASVKTIFLSSNPKMYDIENAKYANPIELEDGELVKLESNGKIYKVVDMRPKKFEYISDPIHFKLVK